jgi:dTDP-4-dehydrorhamnose 3,5-epimerase
MPVDIVPKPFGDCSDVLELRPRKFADSRGFFSEVYNRADLAAAGIDINFIQDNHSLSCDAGTVRGLHFQAPPFAQAKLIRVTKGVIFDVAVDIRNGSPTYGQHISVTISADNWNQLLVPAGFAHGFCTLEPNTEVLYKVDAPYSPEHDRGIQWDDPELAIDWPVREEDAVLSEKDSNQPRLSELPAIFHYAK